MEPSSKGLVRPMAIYWFIKLEKICRTECNQEIPLRIKGISLLFFVHTQQTLIGFKMYSGVLEV